MRRLIIAFFVVQTFLIGTTFFLQPACAEVEWTTTKKMNLKAAPLDSAPSADGQRLFILTRGEILIYSIPQYKVMNRIPVDKSFDKLTISPKSNSLIITSSTKKTLEIIQLEFIQNIDISGLPVKGPKGAPVTIAVFSDYQ